MIELKLARSQHRLFSKQKTCKGNVNKALIANVMQGGEKMESIYPTAMRRTILLAAADSSTRELMQQTFANSNYLLIEASDGEQTLDLIQRLWPDVALLDLALSGLDAISICERIHQFSAAEKMFFIVTGNYRDEDVKRAFKAGADDFVEKPIRPLLLRQRVDYLIKKKHALGSQQILQNVVESERVKAEELEKERAALADRLAESTEQLANALKSIDGRRKFMETALNEITAGIVIADVQGIVTFINRVALNTFETAANECLGKPISKLFGGSKEFQQDFSELQFGQDKRIEVIYKSKSGRKTEIGMTIVRLAQDSLTEFGYSILFRDLGAQRQTELELRRVERLTALGQMAAGFAHEIRNPLAALRSLAEALLAETPSSDFRREYIFRQMSLLKRIERLMTTSLQFSQPSAPIFESHLLQELIGDALDILAPRFKRYMSKPVFETEPDLPRVYVDDAQLVEVLMALIENALEAVEDPGCIHIAAYRTDAVNLNLGNENTNRKFVQIDVTDSGPGIQEEILPHIFDPFFTTKPKGTGLGLSIAQRLIKENGGHLLVSSNRNVETTFSVLLPEEEKKLKSAPPVPKEQVM
jgi:PAS domain S-box-containing protein